jgi:Skp family chaperone for outer membrane proteins
LKIANAAFALFCSGLLVVPALAQQQPAPARPQPAPPTAAPVQTTTLPDGKIAVIDSDRFADPKTGIKRLLNAFGQVDREFKPQRDDVQRMKTQYDQLVRDIETTRGVADRSALEAKSDQAETLKRDIERKTQDGQQALERRAKELTDPIFRDINTALLAYARQRGVMLILDLSKTGAAVFLVNEAVDLTPGFIAEFNQKFPA